MKAPFSVVLLALFVIPCFAQEKRHTISVPMFQKEGQIYLRSVINGKEVFAMLDSGTTETMLDESILSQKNCKRTSLVGTGGTASACRAEATVTVSGLNFPPNVLVTKLPGALKAIIPLRALAPKGIVTLDFENERINITR